MINFKNVIKRYDKTNAIDNVSINILDKKIYCLLGRNGAGKTTFLNLISGKIPLTSGTLEINNKKTSTLDMPENVTYIETAKTQFNMKVIELINFASELNDEFDKEFALKMIEKFHLDKNKKYKKLSFGMKIMLTTIIALSSNKEIILLDEPVLGFDAVMRVEFYQLLKESFEERPRIIIISTHLIDEIANSIDHVLIIDKGKIVLNSEIDQINEKSYMITGLVDDVNQMTEGLNVLNKEKIGKFMNAYIYDKRPIMKSDNIEITNVSLQDLFINMVGGKENE